MSRRRCVIHRFEQHRLDEAPGLDFFPRLGQGPQGGEGYAEGSRRGRPLSQPDWSSRPAGPRRAGFDNGGADGAKDPDEPAGGVTRPGPVHPFLAFHLRRTGRESAGRPRDLARRTSDGLVAVFLLAMNQKFCSRGKSAVTARFSWICINPASFRRWKISWDPVAGTSSKSRQWVETRARPA